VTSALDRLTELVDRLRGPDGCPWDRVQTPRSLAGYLIEEAAEAAQAIVEEGAAAACAELGDLLFQILFIARIYEGQGEFSLADAAEAARAKMIGRHPHVFGRLRLETPEAVLVNWAKLKRAENGAENGVLDSVPRGLPGLLRAHRLSQRAATVGFDWDGPRAVLAKVEEELAELKAHLAETTAGRTEPVAEELGDLFFSLANLARHLRLNAEEVVQAANAKFQRRFQALEADFRGQGRDPAQATAAELDSAWEKAKAAEGGGGGR
jgi:MazG family protein